MDDSSLKRFAISKFKRAIPDRLIFMASPCSMTNQCSSMLLTSTCANSLLQGQRGQDSGVSNVAKDRRSPAHYTTFCKDPTDILN